MSDILKKILSVKHEEIINRKRRLPLVQLMSAIEGLPKFQDLHLALKKKNEASLPGVIAEIKKASPSKGLYASISTLVRLQGSMKQQVRHVFPSSPTKLFSKEMRLT